MSHEVQHKLNKLIDLIDSPMLLLGSYTLSQYKDILGIIATIITVLYTLYKWRSEYLKSKK